MRKYEKGGRIMIISTLALTLALGMAQAEPANDEAQAGAEAGPIVFVELWSARPEWHALSTEERAAYIDSILPTIAGLQEMGVELRFNALSDPDTSNDAGYTYIGVLTMPDRDTARAFEAAVSDSGFYDYFDQINARGEAVAPEAIFGAMIAE